MQAVELSAGDPWEIEGAKERLVHKLGLTLGDVSQLAAELEPNNLLTSLARVMIVTVAMPSWRACVV